MKKIFAYLLLAFLPGFMLAQNIPSPQEFLGYPLGSRYTPHHQIVAYFQMVANALPQQTKLVKYGETYERRPLYTLYLSSAANMARLDEIRKQNLALAGLNGSTSPAAGQPAIVWLSYNVHGNEPSSSEAAMQTLWELATRRNPATDQWLQRTVVVMDPCLNPDGRDRYAHWFNGMLGIRPDPLPQSREHLEPWPGGRVNHYYFDLNRDWAWQTQVESQQRVKLYNQWLPQIHVDFHEQGYDQPYYFAPAAEPFHERISPWQRRMQGYIGRNHARYFDEQGWLYFTRERFDLLYPAYGDTYPMYNGSIGMTYEQAGHSRGGVAVITSSGDTLRLEDRIAHHRTTGLSTVETAARLSDSLLTAFQQYFRNSASASGYTYKYYVLTAPHAEQLQAAEKLLQQNDIRYEKVGNVQGNGWRYSTARSENFSVRGPALVINMAQPKSVLATVLFEPKTSLSDSATYDITAWSIPYSFGLEGYATTTAPATQAFAATAFAPVRSSYGYALPWRSTGGARMLASLLRRNIKVRTAQKPFTAGGQAFGRGTLIVLKAGNPADLETVVNSEAQRLGLQPVALSGGMVEAGADFGSPDVAFVKAPKVALVSGEGTSDLNTGALWHYFDQVLDYPVTLINLKDLGRLDLRSFDVLLMPDGNYRGLSDKNMQEKIKGFVEQGGRLVGIQNGAAQAGTQLFGLQNADEEAEDTAAYSRLRIFEQRERDEVSRNTPGAIYRVELDETHPLAFGYGKNYYTLKQDPYRFNFLKDGWNVGVLKRKMLMSGFVGSKLQNRLQDQLVFGSQRFGGGQVVYLLDDPIFRSFWEQGKLLLANALFMPMD